MDATPPPPPPLGALTSVVVLDRRPPSAPSPSLSLSPSLFIIAAIIILVVVASFSIHLLLRFLSCRRRSSSAVAALPLPLVNSRSPSGSSTSAASDESALSDRGNAAALIESLPVFTLASALASLPKSSPECAVCLCPFCPDDELRLLPVCRHAFHSSCVDPWLHNTPSCPLCRASISLPAPPFQLPLPTSAAPIAGERDASRSGSFRIEIGSVSRRRTTSGEEPGNPTAALSQQLRTYSIGSSFEYLVEEEVEAVVARIARRIEKVEKQGDAGEAADSEPAPPGEGVAEAAGGGRGWLKEYVDRLASSASSSFSSLRFSGRWSHRYDGDSSAISGGQNAWDLEGSARREAEEGGYYGFYRWLIGA
ncbi:E3 ubiquitin-protein ligase [Canna indica]|uniref:E3 ubiquitin-protein ligase n=1 Tax=Canna indica TaxID=4628 RepID=A0AAQ3KC95_9LILI|nr:E3 ubiquitin-protein ligase [Canna indica]